MEGQIELLEYVKYLEMQGKRAGKPEKEIKEILDKEKEAVKKRGYKSNWVDAVPDTKEPDTFFIKKGKSAHYKSDCPFYEGYWLSGGCGGVQCSKGGILPGALHVRLCQGKKENCPYYKKFKNEVAT